MKSSLLNLAVSLIICATAIVGLCYWYADISKKSAAVKDLQNQMTERIQAVEKLKLTQATLAEIAIDEAAVSGYFVQETEIVALIDELVSRGAALGTKVEIKSVSSDKKAAKPALALALSIRGTFDAVLRTAGSIEFSPHKISVSNFTLTKDGAENGWRADMTILAGSSNSDVNQKKP